MKWYIEKNCSIFSVLFSIKLIKELNTRAPWARMFQFIYFNLFTNIDPLRYVKWKWVEVEPFTANHKSRPFCTGYSFSGSSGHSNTLHSSYINRENSSDSAMWGVRLHARDNIHALRSSEWIQLDALWSCSHSCLKTSVDIFLQTCHPVLPWGPCCPLKWTQKAVRLEQNREGWGLEGGICYQVRRVMKGVQPEVSLMVMLCPGDWMSITGQQLDEEDVVNMSHAAWWKKEPFSCGGVEQK